MKILITGICGFVGSRLAQALIAAQADLEIFGIDNFLRPGSAGNRSVLTTLGIRVFHGDIRMTADLEVLPSVDWVIDAAAHPSVLAGVDGRTSSRQLVEHNLSGTLQLLEFCKMRRAGLILLSTSRVYSIPPLSGLPVVAKDGAYILVENKELPVGVSAAGVTEDFSTATPVSLYGATKLASEMMALEYGATFELPVWVNRCGVLAGAGQFGRPDQGIFAYWINAWLRNRPLRYTGFDGKGAQVRDAFHPVDLARLLLLQMERQGSAGRRIFNVGGGAENSSSLAQLSAWCSERFGTREVAAAPDPRPFDIPWMVMDARRVKEKFGWQPELSLPQILEEIAVHAANHPEWLEIST